MGIAEEPGDFILELRSIFGDIINHAHKSDIVVMWATDAISKIDARRGNEDGNELPSNS